MYCLLLAELITERLNLNGNILYLNRDKTFIEVHVIGRSSVIEVCICVNSQYVLRDVPILHSWYLYETYVE